MTWSAKTHCKICEFVCAGDDDMCPNRDNVCKFCCCLCEEGDDKVECEWGGDRNSVEQTENARIGNPQPERIVTYYPDGTVTETGA